MSAKSDTKKSTKSTNKRFTDAEQAAMKERANELKAEARASKNREEGEKDVRAKIAEMSEADQVLAARLHTIITANAPQLMPRTWYGMPAYANNDGKIVCFFQSAQKFETRYWTLGFNDSAHLDDGNLWPVSFALMALTPDVETRIGELVKKAAS